MDEVFFVIDGFIASGKPATIYTANPNHIRLYRTNPEFARAYDEADLVTADGEPVI